MSSRSEEKRLYYLKNRERIIATVTKYYLANRGEKIKYQSERETQEQCKESKREYYERNKEKILLRQKNNRVTLEKQNEKQKARSKQQVEELHDDYVAALISRKGGRKDVLKNKELIGVKRATILLKREIKKHDEKRGD